MADQTSNKLLEEYEETTKNTINLLHFKLEEIKSYRLKLNSHITASMCTSIVGELITVICLLTAPFTGGKSVITGAALGAILELVGGFYSILVYAIDIFVSNDFEKNILKIVEKRYRVENELQQVSDCLQNRIKSSVNSRKDVDKALTILFSGYFKSSQAYKLLQIYKLSKHFSSFGLRQGGKIWKEMREFSEFIKDNLLKIGINIGKQASLKVVRNATIIYNSIFVLWGVKELVDIWSKNHPQADKVADLIKSFDRDLQRVGQLKNL